jgi:serine/threonine-protein kinase
MQVRSVVRLVRPLGRGGMGSVWVAEHLTLRTEVVVKFMSETLASDPVSTARFWREASSAAAVKSPHVVQMLDHGFMADGTAFIIMELLDGEDLNHRLLRDRVVPLPELAVIVTQACKALSRAHAAGIIHRDIKPDNIFLCRTDDGEPFVKLLDFGVAKLGGAGDLHMTQTGMVVGTPYYMSPEQALGSPPVDATTDLWSLGVVAFEAMTGVRPFDGPTMGALTMAICSERPPVPSQVNPQIPPAVDAWLARACAREREQRFPTAREMSDALVAALHGSSFPRVVPLAFEATKSSRGSSRPPGAPAPSPERLPGLGTTTTPTSRSAKPDDSRAASTAPVPALEPAGGPSLRSRGPYLALGAALLALGVAAGFAVASSDRVRAPLAPSPAFAASVATATAPVTMTPDAGGVRSQPADSAWVVSSAASATRPAPVPERPPAPRTQANAASARPGTTSAPPVAAAVTPAPSAAVSVAAPPSSASPTTSCDPPYFFDAAHNKVFKKECL